MSDTGGTLSIVLDLIKISGKDVISLEEGFYAHIMIKDNGHGMDAETLSHIFEPYFSTKKKGEGTGLGLYIVYGIVSSMKGEINVYSEPGKGTVFHLYFPVIEGNFVYKDEKEQEQLPSGNEKILLIDDDLSVLNSMQLILETLGYSVKSFNSSSDAVEAFCSEKSSFDLVITDMTMPDYTGAEIADQLLTINKNQKIILITGLSESFSPEKINKMGFSGYLSKPVLKKDLARTVRSVLDKKQVF